MTKTDETDEEEDDLTKQPLISPRQDPQRVPKQSRLTAQMNTGAHNHTTDAISDEYDDKMTPPPSYI
jgi:hypothetical protein